MTAQIVSIMEARTVTGPAKNLIRFAGDNRERIAFHIVTYARATSETDIRSYRNQFLEACESTEIPVSLIWERNRFDAGVLARLAERISLLDPQLVQTHSVKSHFLLSLIKKKIGVPWIGFHHGYTAEDLKMRVFNQIDRFSLTRADAVLTVCQPFARSLAKYGIPEERIHVLHNSLDPSWAQRPGLAAEAAAIRESLRTRGAAPVILCVGRFSREKGHAVLLAAATRLRAALVTSERPVPFTLLLVGDGPLRGALETQIRTEQLESVVHLAGHRRDLPPYFAAANLLVLPSLSEGSPNVLLEAMSARLPIAATDVGGVGEVVQHENTALIVPSNNPAELAFAMQRLLENPDLGQRLADRAYQRLIERFSTAAYDNNLFGLYEQMLQHTVTQ